jgi:hypothetical protein
MESLGPEFEVASRQRSDKLGESLAIGITSFPTKIRKRHLWSTGNRLICLESQACYQSHIIAGPDRRHSSECY